MRYSTTQRCPKQETKKMKTPPKTPKHQWWRSNTCLMIWWTASEYCGKQPLWQGGTAENDYQWLHALHDAWQAQSSSHRADLWHHWAESSIIATLNCWNRIAIVMYVYQQMRCKCVCLYVSYVYIYVYIIYINMLHEHVLIIQWNNQAHVISLIVWFTYVLDG